MDGLAIVVGNANVELGKKICKSLHISLTKALVGRFSEGEIRVQIQDNPIVLADFSHFFGRGSQLQPHPFRLRPDYYILHHRHGRNHLKMLVDHPNPQVDGIPRGREANLFILIYDPTAVGAVSPIKTFSYSRFPRPILPQQTVDLPLPYLQGDIVIGHHPREDLGQILHPENDLLIVL